MRNIIDRIGRIEKNSRKDEVDSLSEELDQLNDVAEDLMEGGGISPGGTETITLD